MGFKSLLISNFLISSWPDIKKRAWDDFQVFGAHVYFYSSLLKSCSRLSAFFFPRCVGSLGSCHPQRGMDIGCYGDMVHGHGSMMSHQDVQHDDREESCHGLSSPRSRSWHEYPGQVVCWEMRQRCGCLKLNPPGRLWEMLGSLLRYSTQRMRSSDIHTQLHPS